MQQRCPSRENLGGAPSIGTVPSAVKWTQNIGSFLEAAPAVGADGTIYMGSTDLYALNPADGSQAWVSLIGKLLGPPTIRADGSLLVVDESAVLHAIQSDGAALWTYAMDADNDDYLGSPVVAADGTIYVFTAAGLYSIASGGTLNWFQSGSYRTNPALASDGTVYIMSDTQLFAIHPDQVGAWSFTPSGQETLDGPVVAADGTIYITAYSTANFDGFIYALSATGKQLWSLELGTLPGSLSIGHDGTIYTLDEDANVDAVSPSGVLAWSTPFSAGSFTSCGGLVIAGDGTLYAACGNSNVPGSLSALSPTTGQSNWTFSLPIAGQSSPAIGADGTLYFGYQELVAVGP